MKIQTLEQYTEGNSCKIFSLRSFTAADTLRQFHRHSFYQIVLLRNGSMKHFIDFEWKTAKAPFISVIFPNQIHMMELSDDAQTDIIMFDQTVFCSALLANELREYNIDLKKRLNYVTDIKGVEWEEILGAVRQIRRLSSEMTMIKNLEIKFLIKIILLKAIEMAPMTYTIDPGDKDLQVYQRFMEMLEKNYATQMKAKEYAVKLGVLPKRLVTACYKYTGNTPLKLMHERLFMELKRMILEDGLSFKEIAYRLNFSSQSALNKLIEAEYGCTPNQWKQALEISVLGKQKEI